MSSVLSAKHFHDEAAAFAWVEERLWPNGPVCPHCCGAERIGKMGGSATRLGLFKCYKCRQQFTVKVGTVMEASHVPMHIWLQAIALLTSSKKGISTNQLHRTLGVTLKTAWFLSHRIREAMRDGNLSPMGGGGGVVEADETYLWKKAEANQRTTVKVTGRPFKRKSTIGNKRAIIALVERGGSVRSFHVENADKATINVIVGENISREARVHTDESKIYQDVASHAAEHETVKHAAKEYVRGDVTTNTIEGVFGIFKRGMRGIYQHCAEKHLHRYLAEFDFRYNNRIAVGIDDKGRADNALRGIVGKRLTYQTTRQE